MKIVTLTALLWLIFSNIAGAQTTVVGYSAVTSVFLPFWIGKEAGLYKKEGLDVQLVYIASSTTMAQAMFAREVAISTVNSGSVVSSGLQGGDLVLMGAVMKDRKSTRLNSSHLVISYAVFCLKKKSRRSHARARRSILAIS